jgi:hypothetical protein
VEEQVVRRTADTLAAGGVLRGRQADPSSVPADSFTSH